MGSVLFSIKLASPSSYFTPEPAGSAIVGACQGLLTTLARVIE